MRILSKKDIGTFSPTQRTQFKTGFEQQMQQVGQTPAQIQQAEQLFGFQGRLTIS